MKTQIWVKYYEIFIITALIIPCSCLCSQTRIRSRRVPGSMRSPASPALEESCGAATRGNTTPAAAASAGTGSSGASHSSVRSLPAGSLCCARASAARSACWVRVSAQSLQGFNMRERITIAQSRQKMLHLIIPINNYYFFFLIQCLVSVLI